MGNKSESFEEFVDGFKKQDAEATWEEIVLSHEKVDYYMGLLQSPKFKRMVEKGDFSVKQKTGRNAEGDEILEFIEIRNRNGEILLMENTAALIAMSERDAAGAEQIEHPSHFDA
jgi:DNA phosphorothioation-dependent restriction protein DptG